MYVNRQVVMTITINRQAGREQMPYMEGSSDHKKLLLPLVLTMKQCDKHCDKHCVLSVGDNEYLGLLTAFKQHYVQGSQAS